MIVNIVAILWAIASLIGAYYSAHNLRDAILDRNYVEEYHIQNGRRLIAKIHLRTAATRTMLLLMLGALAFASYDSLWHRNHHEIVELAWAAVAFVLMLTAYNDSKDYAKLVKSHTDVKREK